MRNKYLHLWAVIWPVFQATFANAQVPIVESRWWTTNGNVRAIAEDSVSGAVYLGGDFTSVSPPRTLPYGADISAATGAPNANVVSPDNTVNASCPDGNGGWFIGGSFLNVNGIARSRVAHINPDGSLDAAWAPSIGGNLVLSLSLKGDTLLIGGEFTQMNGLPRGNLALVDRITGTLYDYNADVGSGAGTQVRDMALKGDTLILAGTFSTVGGAARSRMAQLNIASGALLAWDPGANGSVYTIDRVGDLVYAGGFFTAIGGATRIRIAAVDVNTGLANALNTSADNLVSSLKVVGSQVYAAGAFLHFGGQARNRLAQVSTTGVVGAWNPNANGTVNKLVIVGSDMYICGEFTAIGATVRDHLAALGLPGSSQPFLSVWDPDANGEVESISATPARVYAGGSYTTIGVLSRARLAAFDDATGEPLAWNPGANDRVRTLALGSGVLFVGGDFTQLGSNLAARTRAGAVGLTSDLATSWNPVADATVMDIVANGSTIYLGGAFTTIGGTTHRGLAAVTSSSGALTAWNVTTGGAAQWVEQMILSGDTLFVCGTFSTLNGVNRGPLASVLTTSNTVTSFAPLPNDFVHTMAKRGNVIYASGYFTTIGGLGGQTFVAGVNATTGAHTGWNPAVTSPQYGVVANNTGVYFQCTKPGPGGASLLGIHGFTLASAVQNAYSIGVNGNTLCVEQGSRGRLFLGGDFTLVDGAARQGFAVLRAKPALRIKAALEGPLDGGTGLMGDALRAADLLPHTEPYTGLGYTHVGGGGGENVSQGMLNQTGNDAIVDWVLVELRNAANPILPIATQSALIQRDGDVVDRNGSPIVFNAQTGSYQISVRHRCHLGVMTGNPLTLSGPTTTIDFRSSATATYGTNARKDVNGTMALWAGDASFDGLVKYTGTGNDRDPVLTTVGSTTPNNAVSLYTTRDVNMDGTVKYTGSGNDRDPILVNVGSTTPNNVRVQQLP